MTCLVRYNNNRIFLPAVLYTNLHNSINTNFTIKKLANTISAQEYNAICLYVNFCAMYNITIYCDSNILITVYN